MVHARNFVELEMRVPKVFEGDGEKIVLLQAAVELHFPVSGDGAGRWEMFRSKMERRGMDGCRGEGGDERDF